MKQRSTIADDTQASNAFGPFSHLSRTALLPELQKYLVGNRLHHPLLFFETAEPRFFSRLNRLYEHRLSSQTRTSDDRNEWERLRPDLSSRDRLNWYLRTVVDQGLPCDHHLVGQIWTDPELVTHSCDVLTMLFNGLLASSPLESFMVESERQRLSELPNEIQVFRGHVPVLEHRISWTLNPVVALDWACRSATQSATPNAASLTGTERHFFMPVVTIGTVSKSQIIAFVDRRGEDEILVDPQYVANRETFDVIYIAFDSPTSRNDEQ